MQFYSWTWSKSTKNPEKYSYFKKSTKSLQIVVQQL